MRNKTAIITGASRGIGREIALKLAKNGFNIVLAAKTVEPNPKLQGTILSVAEEVRALGAKAMPFQLDVRDENDIERMVKQTKEVFGGLDVLINNAGAIYLTDTPSTSAKQYDLMQGINARATFLLSRECFKLLKENGGHILSLSPPLSLTPKWLSAHVAYSVSKFNMSIFTLGMAEEFKEYGVAVNSLWPMTLIFTAAIDRLMGDETRKNCRKPQIMADAAFWILSQDPKKFTGNLCLDEDIISKSGKTDLSDYNFDKNAQLLPDLFID